MAFYIALRKLSENDVLAVYSFGVTDDKIGRIQIDKTSGQVSLIEPAPDDQSERLFSRAARKLWLHWERGEYPSATCWAS